MFYGKIYINGKLWKKLPKYSSYSDAYSELSKEYRNSLHLFDSRDTVYYFVDSTNAKYANALWIIGGFLFGYLISYYLGLFSWS